MKVRILVIITVFFTYGCSGNSTTNSNKNKSETSLNTKDLIAKSNKKYGISEIELKKDTLSLVVMNRIIYHPFGKMRTAGDLKRIDPHFNLMEEQKRINI